MKAIGSSVTRGLPVGAQVATCDNSGAKLVEIISVLGHKTVKGRRQAAGVGDMCLVTVKRGKPDMRKQVVQAIIVRQKKEYKRADGMRIKFEDNACVVCKDEKGNPKGTFLKGAVAKEASERWPAVANIASMIV
jgi:large subunit ribosomal protein L14